jgi:ParB-like nuclease domain
VADDEIRVHPVADMFPMLSDDELRDLAEDIKAHGLLHPIVLDDEGRIVDGRNRDAACRIAGITPEYTTLNGHDPVAFILSQNIARRHLNKGQQAILVLRARSSESEDDSRGNVASLLGISEARLSEAGLILDWAEALADEVVKGSTKFDVALAEAKTRRAAASSTDAQMKRLRLQAPDLAELVADEHMSLAEALGALKVRQQQEADRRRATSQLADTMLMFLDPGEALTSAERAEQIVSTLDPTAVPTRPDFSAQRLRRCIATLVTLGDLIARQEDRDGHEPVSVE